MTIQTRNSPLDFAREIAMLASLDHPNIIRMYDASQWGEEMFLALEYMDGGNLWSLATPRSLDNMLEILVGTVMRKLPKGVDYLHSQNYMHCDLKPQNVLLSREGEVKISNFCIAKDASLPLSQTFISTRP